MDQRLATLFCPEHQVRFLSFSLSFYVCLERSYSMLPINHNIHKCTYHLHRNLNPGGYIEVWDMCLSPQLSEFSVKAPWLIRWSEMIIKASEKHRRTMDNAKSCKSQLEAAGFENVVEKQYTWALRSRPNDQQRKDLSASCFVLILFQSSMYKARSF
jgi:hypothetical protein